VSAAAKSLPRPAGRTASVPPDPVAAIGALAAGRRRRIDLGTLGDRVFLGVAGVGLDSAVGEIAERTRLVRGRAVYAYAALRGVAAWTPVPFTLDVDGDEREVLASSIAVANSGRHGGGMRPAPGAVLDDGLLDVVVFGALPKRTLVRSLPRMFDGSHVRDPSVTVLRGRRVRLAAAEALSVWADGERLGHLPAELAVRPAALEVLAPGTA
jgi:diacylglycerol kinase family enzyme